MGDHDLRRILVPDVPPPPMGYAADDLEEPKNFDKFVKYCERLIRTSPEYREYVKYLREHLDMQSCTFLTGVEAGSAALEIHHSIVTLYDITEAVVRRKLARLRPGERFSAMTIANEVVLRHYENSVPLVPVSNTAHQMVHSGLVEVLASQVFGDLPRLVRRYRPYFSEAALDKLRRAAALEADGVRPGRAVRVSPASLAPEPVPPHAALAGAPLPWEEDK